MRKHLGVLLAACMLASLAGCATEPAKPVPGPEKPTEVQVKPTDISTDTEEIEMFKGDDYQMTFKMMGVLNDSNKNVMISPLSINTAIDMAAYGLKDDYKAKLDEFYGKTLNDRTESYKNMEVNEDVLKIANSLWVRDSIMPDVSEDFISKLTENYDAEVSKFDESSAPVINKWVRDKTNGMIDGIIGSIPESLSSIVMNALYFNGEWIEPFDSEYDVREADFKAFSGKQKCDMMYGTVGVYMENKQATAFKKPYRDGYYFIGILPKDDMIDFENFDFKALLESETYEYDVNISIPKFESEYDTSLTGVLSQMGMGFIFEHGAINNILKDPNIGDLVISDIIHKTAIKMTESGTEAAAVTAIMVETCALEMEQPQIKTVELDRPFAYAIVDSQNNILFVGTVNTLE